MEQREATILFANLRGVSSMTGLNIRKLVHLLIQGTAGE